MANKRFDGEGTVRQRKDGLWEAQLRWRDRFDTPKRSSVYAGTKDEVLVKLTKMRARLADDQPATDTRDTVAVWVRHWRDTTLAASDKKQSTRELYSNLARVHIEQGSLADRKLKGIKPSHVEGWLAELRDTKNLSASTIRSTYTVLRAALDTAVRDGMLGKNPVHQVKRPKVTHAEVVKLDSDQVTKLLDETKDSRYHDALLLLCLLGLREGEVLGLRWRDIDDKTMRIHVCRTVTGQGTSLRLEEVKTAKSNRYLPIDAAALGIIKRQRKRLLESQLKAGDRWSTSGDGLVFRTALGSIVDGRNLLRVVETAARRLNLPKGTGVHTLRHAAAVGWLEDGVHIKAVADLLGHSSIAITGDIYGHTSDDTARGAVTRRSAALGLGG